VIDQDIEERIISESSSYMDKQESSEYSVSVGVEAEFFGVGVSTETSFGSSSFLQTTL
jgi:hypothetical protein